MRVTVDEELCGSTGVCMQICPDVFEVRDDGYLDVLQAEPPPPLHERVREAAAGCPTGAIELEE